MRIQPGLVHGRRHVLVEDVRKVHKRACSTCGEVPTGRRMRVEDGSGRSAKTRIFCTGCAVTWARERSEDYLRAAAYVQSDPGVPTIRLGSEPKPRDAESGDMPRDPHVQPTPKGRGVGRVAVPPPVATSTTVSPEAQPVPKDRGRIRRVSLDT